MIDSEYDPETFDCRGCGQPFFNLDDLDDDGDCAGCAYQPTPAERRQTMADMARA